MRNSGINEHSRVVPVERPKNTVNTFSSKCMTLLPCYDITNLESISFLIPSVKPSGGYKPGHGEISMVNNCVNITGLAMSTGKKTNLTF